MRYRFTWKDPDFYDAERDQYRHDLPEEERDRLRELGVGEYITILVDTDNMTTEILGREVKRGS